MNEIFDGIQALNLQEQQQSRRSVSININLAAIRQNLATARRITGGARVFATIKADAYGHGAVPVAHALSPTICQYDIAREGNSPACKGEIADGFAVVSVDEALELRHSGIVKPILVLQGPQSPDACELMHQENLWPVIHDLEQYEWYRQLNLKQSLSAWLKVDTGMGRLGVSIEDANRILHTDDGVNWIGLMTHFACADEPNNPFTEHQLSKFNEVNIRAGMFKSLANSAATLAWPKTHQDWVRPGVMLYGCNPLDGKLPEGVNLVPAMNVEAPLISAKILSAGAGVGYAQSWHCPVAMPVGYVALGYRDGLPRVLDKNATVSINGQLCPIIGRVSMDSIAIDLRGVSNIKPGAHAQFWGAAADIDQLAKAAATINYELLTSIRGCRQYTD
ncbi:MAG: alanine racemase [Patiriisocius sp.]|jgi:alanine racemase